MEEIQLNDNDNSSNSIKSWPMDERPREKLIKEGEHKLSNTELLAILLRTGNKGQSAIELSRALLNKFKTFRGISQVDIPALKETKGLGNAKIAQIRAAIEIGRRFKEEEMKEDRPKITSSKDVIEMFMPRMRDLSKEVFKILLLNSQNRIMDNIEIIEGTVNQAHPFMREIFYKALQNHAVSIICIHNHPSGSPSPSLEDKKFTKDLVQVSKTLEIKVLDHIIIGNDVFYSFADEGLI